MAVTVKKPSLKDIARRVGVSTALVSYVMSGKEKEKRVSGEMAARIRTAAEELNYRPNQIARSLRKGSTTTLGLIVADISNPFFAQMARIIEDEANNFGYTVIFGSSDESAGKSLVLIDTLLNRQVDGFIIVPAENSEDQIRLIQKRNIPLVLIDRYFPEIPTSYVALDNFAAAKDAVNQIIAKGYEKIGIVAYKSRLIHMQERIGGYVDAMKSNHLSKNILIKEIHYNRMKSDIENAMRDIIKGKKADALFFATNQLAITSLYSVNKYKKRIPDDIAIMSFDANESFDFFYTPISYVEQPVSEMARESVRTLISLINGNDKTIQIKLKHKLKLRNSF